MIEEPGYTTVRISRQFRDRLREVAKDSETLEDVLLRTTKPENEREVLSSLGAIERGLQHNMAEVVKSMSGADGPSTNELLEVFHEIEDVRNQVRGIASRIRRGDMGTPKGTPMRNDFSTPIHDTRGGVIGYKPLMPVDLKHLNLQKGDADVEGTPKITVDQLEQEIETLRHNLRTVHDGIQRGTGPDGSNERFKELRVELAELVRQYDALVGALNRTG